MHRLTCSLTIISFYRNAFEARAREIVREVTEASPPA